MTETKVLERGRGEAGGVALVADCDNDPISVRHLGDVMRRGGIETPLEDVPVYDERTRDGTVALSLLDRPSVNEQRSIEHGVQRLLRR